MDGAIPRAGELSPNLVGKALGLNVKEGFAIPELVAPRPPKLCDGCPHFDSYTALNEAMKDYGEYKVFADIGCYTLGALPPLKAIYTTVDMGASITMAKGAAEAELRPTVAVIGDSTFTHSGMTGLLDCCVDNVPVTIMILDNGITGMTGSQKSSATGRIESICQGIGVAPEHIRVINPLSSRLEENVKVIREELEYQGVSVIIPRRECIVWANKKRKLAKNKQSKVRKGDIKMKIDIILCGVGGMGALSSAAIISKAALEMGMYMKQAETHGMSQRGGDVQSHLRLSDQPIASDLIPEGECDIILSVEPMEALRYLPFLNRETGW